MSRIALYRAPDYEIEPQNPDSDQEITIGNPTTHGSLTVAEYQFESEPMFGSPTVYEGRIINTDGSLVGFETEGDLSYFDGIAEKALGVEDPTQIELQPNEMWGILNEVPDHGVYNLRLEHPACGMDDIEDIACRMENTNIASEHDVKHYYEEAQDEEYYVVTGPDLRVDELDFSFSLDQYDAPVKIVPREDPTPADLKVILGLIERHR